MLFQWPFAKVTHFQVSMSNCYSYDSWNSIRLIHSSHWRLQVVYVQNSMLFLCPYRDRQTHCANNDNKPSRLGISYYVYTFKRFFPSISGSDYNVSIAHHIGNTMLFCFVLSSSHQSICLCISGGLILIYFVIADPQSSSRVLLKSPTHSRLIVHTNCGRGIICIPIVQQVNVQMIQRDTSYRRRKTFRLPPSTIAYYKTRSLPTAYILLSLLLLLVAQLRFIYTQVCPSSATICCRC